MSIVPQDIPAIIENDRASGLLLEEKNPLKAGLEAAAAIRAAEPRPALLNVAAPRAGRILGNIFPSRTILAERLGVAPGRFLPDLSRLTGNGTDGPAAEKRSPGSSESGRGKPKPDNAPDRGEKPGLRLFEGEELDPGELSRLPILTYYGLDGGPYLTAGIWVVRDPDSGINLSYHRFMLTGDNRGTVRVVERRGTAAALAGSGGALDAAICIGAPPTVLFAAALSPPADVCEYDFAERLGRIDLRSSGDAGLPVPASCQVILEGRFTGETAPEGPFVDITGTLDGIREQPVFEVRRIIAKKDPIHYTIVPARADHYVLMGVPKELDIYREAGKVCECTDVAITPGGASWLHAVVSIQKNGGDDGPKVIEAAFRAHPSLKQCIVVDDDIDVHDPGRVEWAVATRFQAGRDLHVKTGMPGSSLDPSADHGGGTGSTGAKMGLDATIDATGKNRGIFLRADN